MKLDKRVFGVVGGGAGNRLVGGFLPIWLCHAKTFSTTEFNVDIWLVKLIFGL